MANIGEQGDIHIDPILQRHAKKLRYMHEQFCDPQIVESCDVANRKVLLEILSFLRLNSVLVEDMLAVESARSGMEDRIEAWVSAVHEFPEDPKHQDFWRRLGT